MSDVVVYLVGSHAIIDHNTEDVPFQTKILVGDQDVAGKYNVRDWLANPLTGFTSEVGRRLHDYSSTAASAVKNIIAILNDTNQLTHCPGPEGLIGGFPVRLGRTAQLSAFRKAWILPTRSPQTRMHADSMGSRGSRLTGPLCTQTNVAAFSVSWDTPVMP